MPAREQTELSVAQKLFISSSKGQLLKIHILAGCLEGFGMETTLLSGRNDTLDHTRSSRVEVVYLYAQKKIIAIIYEKGGTSRAQRSIPAVMAARP